MVPAARSPTSAPAHPLTSSTGKVLLLTNPVSAGYSQNPISVYYCYAAADAPPTTNSNSNAQQQTRSRESLGSGATTPARGTPNGTPATPGGSSRPRTRAQQRLEQEQAGTPWQGQCAGSADPSAAAAAAAVPVKGIAEVTNTPWGDRVRFVFRPAGDESPKALHVSPFMDMDNTWWVWMDGWMDGCDGVSCAMWSTVPTSNPRRKPSTPASQPSTPQRAGTSRPPPRARPSSCRCW